MDKGDVDTWPDWMLDTRSMMYRNRRRAKGESLPKPTKDEILIAALRMQVALLRGALKNLDSRGGLGLDKHDRIRSVLSIPENGPLLSASWYLEVSRLYQELRKEWPMAGGAYGEERREANGLVQPIIDRLQKALGID